MRLIIDIPESVYNQIIEQDLNGIMANAIKKGEPIGDVYTFDQVQELVKLNQQFAEEIENLKRPTGEWYYSCQNGWHCSICQQIVKDMPTVMGKANFDYCPNCGVKMKKEKEND